MRRFLFASIFGVLMACGGTSVDSSDTAPSDGGTAGSGGSHTSTEGGASQTGCSAVSWPGPDAENIAYDCIGVPGAWNCYCEKSWTTSDAATCEQAMQASCGVSPSEPSFCGDIVGTCWPDDDTWLCKCDDGSIVEAVTADTCEQAVWAACDTACESAWGHCAPSEEPGAYDCSCSYYDAERHLWSSGCDAALQQACDPSLGCNSFSGFCDMSETGFSCQCIDGSSAQYTFESLGHDDCLQTIELACGDVEPPAEWTCEAQVGNVRGTCNKLPDASARYDCFCSSSTANGDSAWGNQIDASTCSEALALVCFPE